MGLIFAIYCVFFRFFYGLVQLLPHTGTIFHHLFTIFIVAFSFLTVQENLSMIHHD